MVSTTRLRLLPFALLLFLAACSRPAAERTPDALREGAPVTLEIPFVMSRPATRTVEMAAEDENTFTAQHTQVLVFNQADEFVYSPVVKEVRPNSDAHRTGSIVVEALATEQPQTFVVLAGVQTKQNPALNQKKSAFLASYTFDMAGKYPTGWGPVSLPMWGEVAVPKVKAADKGTTHVEETLYLLRAVASLDVKVPAGLKRGSDSVAVRLTSVRLFRTMDHGSYAPAVPLDSDHQVTAPSRLTSAQPSNQPIAAEHLPGKAPRLYFPETPNSSGMVVTDRPYAVIGLTDDKGDDSMETYYRIDFLRDNGKGVYNYIDLLRNHLYTIEVNQVFGPGYPDVEKAKDAPSHLLSFKLLGWRPYVMEATYDGNVELYVEKRFFKIGVEGREYKDLPITIRVRTNWQRGWHFGKVYATDLQGHRPPSNSEPWGNPEVTTIDGKPIDNTYPEQTVGQLSKVEIYIGESYDNERNHFSRLVIIPIHAGRLTTYVVVRQIPDPDL